MGAPSESDGERVGDHDIHDVRSGSTTGWANSNAEEAADADETMTKTDIAASREDDADASKMRKLSLSGCRKQSSHADAGAVDSSQNVVTDGSSPTNMESEGGKSDRSTSLAVSDMHAVEHDEDGDRSDDNDEDEEEEEKDDEDADAETDEDELIRQKLEAMASTSGSPTPTPDSAPMNISGSVTPQQNGHGFEWHEEDAEHEIVSEDENETENMTGDSTENIEDEGSDVILAFQRPDHDDDADSALGEESAMSSRSATSSLYHFVEEYGRTFHKYKQGRYFLPNDEQEQQRMDLQHHIIKLALERLYLAPIVKPNRVLDIGTGTGIWAAEFADHNPESDVVGTDLSPIQPSWVPSNCRFEIDDVEDDWVWSYRFDFIHMRSVSMFLTDIPKVLKSMYWGVNPGGWVEITDLYIPLQSRGQTMQGKAIETWNRLLLQGIARLRRNPWTPRQHKQRLIEAGFVNITERLRPVPMNDWAEGRKNKILGRMMIDNAKEGLFALSAWPFMKGLGWSREQLELLLVGVRNDIMNRNIQGYALLSTFYGQRPPDGYM